MTGKLVPIIEGIAFSTASESGTTNTQGQFTYRAGEIVEFRLGGIRLGAVSAADELTVFDLAQTPVITGTHSLLEAVSTPIIRSSGTDATLPPPAARWRPFHLVMNRLFLLHNLDRDQDPANGVQIDPAMAELLDGVSVGFNQNWRDFRELLTIRKARVEGLAVGAFEGALAQVSYPDILDSTYAAMDVSPDIFNMTRQQYSENSAIDYKYNDRNMLIRRMGWKDLAYRYDDRDNIVWRQDECGVVFESNYDATGNKLNDTSPYAITTFKYDSYGSLVRREEDRGLNGEIDSYTTVETDERGRAVRIEEKKGDGLPDVELIRYDNRGNRVRWERRRGDDTDIHIQRFDAQNQLTWRESIDSPGNYSQQKWKYDEQGYVTASSIAYYVNDQLTREDYQTYNLRGNVVRWERDEDGNGALDSIVIRFWNNKGNETERAVDTNADGTANEITHWEYDRGGMVTVTRIDTNADGTPDTVIPSRSRYEYDERGNKVLFQQKGGDGYAEWLTRYAYDAANNLILEDEEIGFYELTTHYKYKAMGWRGIFFARDRVRNEELFDYYPCL
jgi:hypothetical protein